MLVTVFHLRESSYEKTGRRRRAFPFAKSTAVGETVPALVPRYVVAGVVRIHTRGAIRAKNNVTGSVEEGKEGNTSSPVTSVQVNVKEGPVALGNLTLSAKNIVRADQRRYGSRTRADGNVIKYKVYVIQIREVDTNLRTSAMNIVGDENRRRGGGDTIVIKVEVHVFRLG